MARPITGPRPGWARCEPMECWSACVYTVLVLFAGVALCPGTELADLYAGLWGYCPLLTACALGSIFFVFNAQSVVLALVGAATAALAYGALQRTLLPVGRSNQCSRQSIFFLFAA